MVVCEFSGEECEKTIKVEIAGAVMNVSSKYTHLGKIIADNSDTYSKLDSVRKQQKNMKSQTENIDDKFSSSNPIYSPKKYIKTELKVVENAVSLIQSYMAKNNLTIKHVSHNANVKEGTLQKMLSRKIQFDIKVAMQIEKTFKIPLTMEVEINEEQNTNSENYTIDNSLDDSSTTSMEDLLKGVLKDIK